MKWDGAILKFLLVPDASTARRLRRILAERSVFSSFVVGTWTELVEWACRAYLVPMAIKNYDSDFKGAAEELEGAF